MKSEVFSCLFKVPASILNAAAPSDGLFGDEKQMKHN
jgi:hypothetical protein